MRFFEIPQRGNIKTAYRIHFIVSNRQQKHKKQHLTSRTRTHTDTDTNQFMYINDLFCFMHAKT